MQEKLLTTGQVAEICQVSVPTVLNWINSELLPSYKTAGGHNRLSALGLLQFLCERSMFIPEELYEMAGVDPASYQSSHSRQKPIAIIADDDAIVRSLIREVLDSVNYVVVEVNDGLEACLQMGLLRPELLILDLFMPQMDGRQVVQTLRNQPECQATRIIVISGHLDEETRRELESAGIEHILEKPVPITEFIRLAGLGREVH